MFDVAVKEFKPVAEIAALSPHELQKFEVSGEVLIDCCRLFLDFLSSASSSSLDESQLQDRQLATLAQREQEVIDKLRSDYNSKQIAKETGISMRTVEGHRQNLLRTPGVSSVKERILRPITRDKSE